jgi:hypothetical protein
MTVPRLSSIPVLVVLGILWVGCASDPGPSNADSSAEAAPSHTDTLTLDSKADSVAHRLMTAHGADALDSAPYLRFNFAVETPKGTRVIARHLWDRTTGDYRVEWQSGPDSSYVALVNVRNVTDKMPVGTAYLNGTELTGTAAEEARREAYGRFINDTYWLLAPLKVFDSGVNRNSLPDSATAQHDVLHLTFGDVGLTPGDEYWLYVSKGTGRLDQWAYHLQSMGEDTPPQRFDWTGYTTLQAPDGPVELATRKEAVGAEQAIVTNELALPARPPDGAFSTPEPMLAPSTNEGSS